jgi:hypothetical protein
MSRPVPALHRKYHYEAYVLWEDGTWTVQGAEGDCGFSIECVETQGSH